MHHAVGSTSAAPTRSTTELDPHARCARSCVARGACRAGANRPASDAGTPAPTLDPDVQDILQPALARPRARHRGAVARGRAAAGARAARDSAARLGCGRRARDVRAAEGRRGARRRSSSTRCIDPNQDFAVRRRLARVFSVCVSQRAADGADARPRRPPLRRPLPVRPLARRDRREEPARPDRPRADLRGRAARGRGRPSGLGKPPAARRLRAAQSPLDEFVRDRAGESLAHVFTLLSLVLPREPLQIAFRSLQTDDEHLRGTALEYLEGVLPAPIRQRLWPFLEQRPSRHVGASARGSHRRPAALEPFDHAEPRGAAAPNGRHGSVAATV